MAPGHVEGRPDGDAVAEMFGEDAGVVAEVAGEVAVRPAAAVFERLWQVPVLHGAPGADAGFEQGVDEAAVWSMPFMLGAPVPVGWMRGQEIEKRWLF